MADFDLVDLTADDKPADLPQEPEQSSSDPKVRVVTANVRSFRTTTASGDTLVVTQTGVSVPEGDVDSLIADAARSGVTLERSK